MAAYSSLGVLDHYTGLNEGAGIYVSKLVLHDAVLLTY